MWYYNTRSPDKLETGKNVSEESPDEERINKTRRIQNKKKLKLKLMENKGFFADHCKEFDESHMVTRIGFCLSLCGVCFCMFPVIVWV
jgi:hypothetical protein